MANTEKIPIYPLTSDSFNLKKTDEFSFEIRIAICPTISEKEKRVQMAIRRGEVPCSNNG